MGDPSDSFPRFDDYYKLDPTFYPTYEQQPRFKLLDKKLRLDPDVELQLEQLPIRPQKAREHVLTSEMSLEHRDLRSAVGAAG